MSHRLDSSPPWPGYFANSRVLVHEAVSKYDSYLRATWPQHEALRAQRQRRWVSPFGPMPYYLPFWLADVFPSVNLHDLRAVGVANVFLYHYYTLKDDHADGVSYIGTREILAADAIFGEGLHHLAQAHVTGKDFYRDLGQYMVAAVRAETLLQFYSSRRLPYTGEALALMGQKAALAKVSAAALATITGRRSLLRRIESSLDDMAVGLQLLDDLQDWQEDLARGHFTYPLWLAAATAPSFKSSPRLEQRLASDTVTGEVLRQMEVYCGRAQSHFTTIGAVNVASYLQNLVRGSTHVRARIEREHLDWNGVRRAILTHMQGNGT